MPTVARCELGCPCEEIPIWVEVFEDYEEAKKAADIHVGTASVKDISRELAESIDPEF